MASTPRANIADDVIQGLHCAICGEDTLHVVHIDRLPDYVECNHCKSAFIMEDGGERVLYGQIAEGFPQTSQFALKQWVWIEAVETRAHEERAPQPEEPSAPADAGLDEEWQSPAPEEAEVEAPETSRQAQDQWTIFDDSEPTIDLEPVEREEIAPEQEEESTQDLTQSPTEESPDMELMDEEDLFEGLIEGSYEVEDEPEITESIESGATSVEEGLVEDPEELAGFDWLGGLADEDTMLEEPGLPHASEHPAQEKLTDEIGAQEAGLSAEDLDDLFKPEIEQDADLPTPTEEIQGPSADEDDSDGLPEWSSQEPETAEDADDNDQFDSAWLDDIEIDEQEPEPETPLAEHGEFAAESDEQADEWSEWRSQDLEVTDDSTEEDQPPEDWMAERILSGTLEPEPELSGADNSDEGLSLDEDDTGDDFLSSLRDSAAIPLESQPLEDQFLGETDQDDERPSVPAWALEEEQEETDAMVARMQAVTSGEQDQTPAPGLEELPEAEEQAEKEPISKDEIDFRETDPLPGYRHRVVIGGERVIFPGGECVHCGLTPVKGKLAIAGTLPSGQGMADRKPTRFEVSLCGECRDRATRLSEDAKSARTQSFLFSAIIGLSFVVGALAFNLVDPADMQFADIFILIILFTIGFAGSAILLLNRISNYPPPLDAAYVRTTLLVPSETQGLETAFEWRNVDYAERFYEANQSKALGNVTRVKDRLILERS